MAAPEQTTAVAAADLARQLEDARAMIAEARAERDEAVVLAAALSAREGFPPMIDQSRAIVRIPISGIVAASFVEFDCAQGNIPQSMAEEFGAELEAGGGHKKTRREVVFALAESQAARVSYGRRRAFH